VREPVFKQAALQCQYFFEGFLLPRRVGMAWSGKVDPAAF